MHRTIILSALFPLLFAAAPLAAQSLDGCGLDSLPRLNAHEGAWLNQHFASQRGAFDFTGKQIAFVTGSGGSVIESKKTYFQNVNNWQSNGSTVIDQLYMLTAAEQLRSGGYDAIVLSWVKFFSHHSRNKVIRQLGANR